MGTGRASTRCCPRALSEQSPASPLALSRYAGARVYGTVEKVWSGVSAVVAVCYDQPRQTARFRHSRWRSGVLPADVLRCRRGSCLCSSASLARNCYVLLSVACSRASFLPNCLFWKPFPLLRTSSRCPLRRCSFLCSRHHLPLPAALRCSLCFCD